MSAGEILVPESDNLGCGTSVGEIFDPERDCEHYDMCVEEGGEPSSDDCSLCRDLNTDETYNVVVVNENGIVTWRTFPGTNVAFDLKHIKQLAAEGLTVIDQGMTDKEANAIAHSHLTPDGVLFAAMADVMGNDGTVSPELRALALQNAWCILALAGFRRVNSLDSGSLPPMISDGEL